MYESKRYRTFLTNLACSGNGLKELKVDKLVNLLQLSCAKNQLEELDITPLTKLANFDCSYNKFKAVIDVRHLADLGRYKNAGNKLTTVELNNPKLFELDLSDNQLTTLDIDQPELHTLNVSRNQLTTLDLNHLKKMEYLDVHNNQLKKLKIDQLTALNRLKCNVNQLTELKFSHLTTLEELYCGTNLLTTFDVSALVNLKRVDCDHNRLASLDLSKTPDMKGFYWINDQQVKAQAVDVGPHYQIDLTKLPGFLDKSKVSVSTPGYTYDAATGILQIDKSVGVNGIVSYNYLTDYRFKADDPKDLYMDVHLWWNVEGAEPPTKPTTAPSTTTTVATPPDATTIAPTTTAVATTAGATTIAPTTKPPVKTTKPKIPATGENTSQFILIGALLVVSGAMLIVLKKKASDC